MIERPIAFWQRSILWSVDRCLATVDADSPGLGVYLDFSGSPLIAQLDQYETLFQSRLEAKRYATDLARKQGYRIVRGDKGMETVKTAGK